MTLTPPQPPAAPAASDALLPGRGDAPPGAALDAESAALCRRAVAAFGRAVYLSCLAARHAPADPARAPTANRAIASRVEAHTWAEEAVRRAAYPGVTRD